MSLITLTQHRQTVEVRNITANDPNFLLGIPQPLYKYRVWEEKNSEEQYSRRILTEMELYFASADQFNDPFDASLPFRYDPLQLTPDNIFLKLIEVGRRDFPNISELELPNIAFNRQNSDMFESSTLFH